MYISASQKLHELLYFFYKKSKLNIRDIEQLGQHHAASKWLTLKVQPRPADYKTCALSHQLVRDGELIDHLMISVLPSLLLAVVFQVHAAKLALRKSHLPDQIPVKTAMIKQVGL